MQINRNTMTVVAVIALAFSLRPALAAIGPVLDMIETTTGMKHTEASLLTTLPVLVMGLCALAGGQMGTKGGEHRSIAGAIGLIAVACGARFMEAGRINLLATAIAAGVGIALVQVLVPAFIKRNFSARASSVLGLYVTGIMAGAAIAAALSAGIAFHWGWPAALAVWGIPAVLALVLWLLATHEAGAAKEPAKTSSVGASASLREFVRNRRAWELLVFFGVGTGAYTLVLAWLPPFYTSLGWSPSEAGMLLGGLTLTEVVAGLAVSAVVGRFPDRRVLLAAALLLLIGGLACLLLAPQELALLACVLLGLGIGSLFPLSLIVALDHVDNPARAGQLAAFVQGGGYIIASIMPLLAGMIRDSFSSLAYAWLIMIAGAALLLLLCLRFTPDSYRSINAA